MIESHEEIFINQILNIYNHISNIHLVFLDLIDVKWILKIFDIPHNSDC